jgi:hypothetical protein
VLLLLLLPWLFSVAQTLSRRGWSLSSTCALAGTASGCRTRCRSEAAAGCNKYYATVVCSVLSCLLLRLVSPVLGNTI